MHLERNDLITKLIKFLPAKKIILLKKTEDDFTRKLLKRFNLTLDDIGLIELNEAFASQSIGVMQKLNMNPDITNVNGGAIALGHPLGCSGARILTTLIHEMKKRDTKYGLATLCVGVGQGVTTLVEGL